MPHEKFAAFYGEYLPGKTIEGTTMSAPCPFCKTRGRKESSTLVVDLDAEGFFAGYFRCLDRCLPGGFAPRFARLLGLDLNLVPDHDPDQQPYVMGVELPLHTVTQDIHKYQASLTTKIIDYFGAAGIGPATLKEMGVGFNGRYLVFPYFLGNRNCYAAHCLSPERPEEHFWHGDETFVTANSLTIFNLEDIDHCEDGALFIVEGEENYLTLRELGLPGVAVPAAQVLERIEPRRFDNLTTVFLVVNNSPESDAAARSFAVRLGFKVRMFHWPADFGRGKNLAALARKDAVGFQAAVDGLIRSARAFSPFASPAREHQLFVENLGRQQSESYLALRTGLDALDNAVGGVHGINIIGGAPKAGKSCFGIQLATQVAATGVPVIYYDFENGRQKIYQRTVSRLSRIPVERLVTGEMDAVERGRYDSANQALADMLHSFRVVNDRQLTPELMRRHIDFLRHETRRDDAVVVVDSLHKLPFKDFSEQRTGIDAWLREFESIRDSLQVAFLVLSELSRQEGGRYDGVPHMGLFKASGDIEYTADNAFVFLPDWDPVTIRPGDERINSLWLVASREFSPGLVAKYRLDYPYWGFSELPVE